MKFHVFGSVDDDQVLSLRFGDAAKEPLPSTTENLLADAFWGGDMQVTLIETFSRPYTAVDFALVLSLVNIMGENRLLLWEATADDWPLDTKVIAEKLDLATPVVICDHNMEKLGMKADNTSNKEAVHAGREGTQEP